jgi:hypothetical protein
LVVQDLLEHLAHAGAHEVASLGVRVVVAAPDPGALARIQVLKAAILVVHAAILAPPERCVNSDPPAV